MTLLQQMVYQLKGSQCFDMRKGLCLENVKVSERFGLKSKKTLLYKHVKCFYFLFLRGGVYCSIPD